jgi:tetratricopeptide (TPR) repeat protein
VKKRKSLMVLGVLFGISCGLSCIFLFAAIWYRYEAVSLKQSLYLMQLRKVPDRDSFEMLMRLRAREARDAEKSLDFMSWKRMLQDELQTAGTRLAGSMRGIRELRRHKELGNSLYYALGLVYSASGNMQSAKTAFVQALQYDTRDAESLYNLGLIFSLSVGKSDIAQARGFYTKYLEVSADEYKKSVVRKRIAEMDTMEIGGS